MRHTTVNFFASVLNHLNLKKTIDQLSSLLKKNANTYLILISLFHLNKSYGFINWCGRK